MSSIKIESTIEQRSDEFVFFNMLKSLQNLHSHFLQLRLHRRQILRTPTPFHLVLQNHQEFAAHIGFIVMDTHLATATCTAVNAQEFVNNGIKWRWPMNVRVAGRWENKNGDLRAGDVSVFLGFFEKALSSFWESNHSRFLLLYFLDFDFQFSLSTIFIEIQKRVAYINKRVVYIKEAESRWSF